MDHGVQSKVNSALSQMEKHVTELESAMTHCNGEKALNALRLYYKNITTVRDFHGLPPYVENAIYGFDKRIERAVDRIGGCTCDCKEKK